MKVDYVICKKDGEGDDDSYTIKNLIWVLIPLEINLFTKLIKPDLIGIIMISFQKPDFRLNVFCQINGKYIVNLNRVHKSPLKLNLSKKSVTFNIFATSIDRYTL